MGLNNKPQANQAAKEYKFKEHQLKKNDKHKFIQGESKFIPQTKRKYYSW